VKYTNISSQTPLYIQVQKAVYLWWFPNAALALPLDKPITQQQATTLVRYAYANIGTGAAIPLSFETLRDLLVQIQDNPVQRNIQHQGVSSNSLFQNPVFLDVYTKIQQGFIGTGRLDSGALMQGTIKGYVDALNDPYTSYFPPIDAKSFSDELQGEFFWIGAYVEMTKPGILIITSPITGSPADKIWLQAQDRIVQIDDHVIDKNTPLNTAVSWIKWPAGTKVTLKIIRDSELMTIAVVRAKVVIKSIESERLALSSSSSACIIHIHMFDFGVASDFLSALTSFSGQMCTKYIFDVRNNWGGSLDEVLNMLDPFVPANEPILETRSRTYNEDIVASPNAFKLTGSMIRVLINGASASAAEIFAGVIREYVPNSLLIGSQTFGKWSVQSLINYDDGSMLKYTIAKRYTGKNKQNIDHVGFAPDVKIEDSTGTKIDEVLEYAVKH